MEQKIKLSVRRLIEFVLRSGNLDNRFGGFDRANLGAKLHRKLQKSAGKSYQPEVSLSFQQLYQNILFQIEGRADGIITEANEITVDEIKTTAMPLELIDDSISKMHWAQAKCYGYFICQKQELSSIFIQLTYCHIDTEAIRKIKKEFSLEELEAFFFDLLGLYYTWAKWELNWKKTRNCSIQSLSFPFSSYRKGQRALAVAVYKTISAQERLFCQAPTGIGKTISTLFPSIKAMGEEKADKIFYLTAKTITRQTAEDSISFMRKVSFLQLKTITLTAKEKICFQSEANCNPDACPYAKGHYDRINHAIYELLQNEDAFDRKKIETTAKKHEVCPFELSLDLTLWSDCVICDYNYIFDPQINLKRFFQEKKQKRYLFLIDEAHNLNERAKEMYSAKLNKSDVLQSMKQLDKKEKKLRPVLQKINQEMIKLKKNCTEKPFLVLEKPPELFLKLLSRFQSAWEEWSEQNHSSQEYRQILSFYFQVLSFQKILEFYDDHYVTFISQNTKDVVLRLLCLDPSSFLNETMKHAISSILFSATFSPLSYFISVLGGNQDSKKIQIPSPFPEQNLSLIAACQISTLYQNRENSKKEISDLIYQAVQVKSGNYFIFFPSYQYRDLVYEQFSQNYPEIETILQKTNMSEPEKESFLEKFSSENKRTLLGFCVLGGIYSEGIDLKGNRLIGSIIIGVGLPQVNPEQNLLREYYQKKNYMGYEYAYQYPGMNKVLQAAGRVIRDEQDKGMVLLIDQRFSSPFYQNLFPHHWKNCKFLSHLDQIKQELEGFWHTASKK